jgi:hypothetical protein
MVRRFVPNSILGTYPTIEHWSAGVKLGAASLVIFKGAGFDFFPLISLPFFHPKKIKV